MSQANSAPPAATDLWIFVREFARAPIRTGAIAPSSRRLATTVTAVVPERGDPVVVELGPGTGAFTEQIQRRLGGRGRPLAIELTSGLAELVGRRFPEVGVVPGNAAQPPDILSRHGIERADVV